MIWFALQDERFYSVSSRSFGCKVCDINLYDYQPEQSGFNLCFTCFNTEKQAFLTHYKLTCCSLPGGYPSASLEATALPPCRLNGNLLVSYRLISL